MSNSWVYHCFKHEVILTIYMVHTYIGHLLGKTSPQVKISAQKKKESTSPSNLAIYWGIGMPSSKNFGTKKRKAPPQVKFKGHLYTNYQRPALK